MGPADIAACEQVTTAVLTQFRQVAPASGAPPVRETVLRFGDDGTTLLIEISARDPAPQRIVARQRRRDQEAMLAEDHVAVVIDVRGDGRDGLFFAVNPNGAQFDGLIHDGGSLRSDWDALWHSTAHVDADGWHASLRIPLAALGQHRPEVWRVNAERWAPDGGERLRLAGWRPDRSIHSLGEAVEVRANPDRCETASTRLKLSLRTRHTMVPQGDEDRNAWQLAPGVELFHENRHGLRAALALNIDFGEAEADDRQIYLDRFELFHDEKRTFFLEDAGRFAFGGLDGHAVMPFYSRRIGLDASGHTQKLQAAAKLSGRVAQFDFGVLAARLGAQRATDPETPAPDDAAVAVARISRPLGSRHTLGAIGTMGDPSGSGGHWLVGADHHFRDTAWRGDRTLETRTWLMHSRNPDTNARAMGASLDFPNLGPTGYANLSRVQRGFDPALGYLAEDDVLRGDGSLGWWHRSARGSDVTPALDWSFRRQIHGTERTRELNPEWVFRNAAEDILVLEWFNVQDELANGYSPLPAVDIEPGRHRWNQVRAEAHTSTARRLSLSAVAGAGSYYRGRADEQSLWLAWRPTANWGLSAGAERHAIRQPSGSGRIWLTSLRVDITPHTHFSLSALMQWDSVSEETGISARVHWRDDTRWEVFLALDTLGYTREAPWRRPAHFTGALKFVLNLGS